MADIAALSDMESEAESTDGGGVSGSTSGSSGERLTMRLESLQQENRVLRMELETIRYRCKGLEAENRELKKARVDIQLMAEQQEEYISNTLLKKIEALKNEKEQLARNYEQEEEFLTNELSRKLNQLKSEKTELEGTLAREQEQQMEKLLKRIDKLQNEVTAKQGTLEQLKKDKVELENQLEQEQEALVNRLWKRMDKLETEKRTLQAKLDQPVSAPPSPRHVQAMCIGDSTTDVAGNLIQNIGMLKEEVSKLQAQLRNAQTEHKETMARYAEEERHIRQENVRLQRKLQMEIERREQLCRRLSESESSIEIDEERHFNEMTKRSSVGDMPLSRSSSIPSPGPIPHSPAITGRPLSPATPRSATSLPSASSAHAPLSTSSPSIGGYLSSVLALSQRSHDKFAKPFAMPPAAGTPVVHHRPASLASGELAK